MSAFCQHTSCPTVPEISAMVGTVLKRAVAHYHDEDFCHDYGYLRGFLKEIGVNKLMFDANKVKEFLGYLTGMGADLLREEHDQCARMAASLVLVITFFSRNSGSIGHCGDLFTSESFALGEFSLFCRDFHDDVERATLRWYSKRVDCPHLKERYKQIREQTKTKSRPRMAMCWNCEKLFERKSIMQCTGCRIIQYCSTRCQRDDWEDHRGFCAHFRFADHPSSDHH